MKAFYLCKIVFIPLGVWKKLLSALYMCKGRESTFAHSFNASIVYLSCYKLYVIVSRCHKLVLTQLNEDVTYLWECDCKAPEFKKIKRFKNTIYSKHYIKSNMDHIAFLQVEQSEHALADHQSHWLRKKLT